MYAWRPAGESRKSRKANSDRLKPSSTRRALASLGVHPCRLAMRFKRFPLSTGRRILSTIVRDCFIVPPGVTVVSIVYHVGKNRFLIPAAALPGKFLPRLHCGYTIEAAPCRELLIQNDLFLKHQ